MRLRRLDLTRYGRFTDYSLDFGARGEGTDLHIVYGPNEAGKSTIFNALLDLLYGVPTQSPYNFIHPYATMRIGAALEIGGVERETVRIKRPANSLLDPRGDPLPEAVVTGALGGIGREAYKSMFSLDDESLEVGGKAILESKGELGTILFSATAGLANLTRKLIEIRSKADSFHKYRAHNSELAALKQRLSELREAHKTIDVNASRYDSLVKACNDSQCLYEEALRERGIVQARLDAITTELGLLPRLSALRERRSRLAPLADLPEPPMEWAKQLPELSLEEVKCAVEVKAVEQEIDRLAATLQELVLDEAALAGAPRLAELDTLHPRRQTALEDLPIRRMKLIDEDATIVGLMGRLGRPPGETPTDTILPVAITAALEEAAGRWSGVETAVAAARDSSTEAETKLAAAKRKLDEASMGFSEDAASHREAVEDLTGTLADCRRDDHRPRVRTVAKSLATAQARLDGDAASLAPFRGSVEILAARSAPDPRTVTNWNGTSTRIEDDLRRLHDEQRRLDEEIAGATAERDSHADALHAPSDEQAALIRADRDRAWAQHKSALDATSAAAFEATMHLDDDTGARRLEVASRQARIRQMDASLASLRARRVALDAARVRSLEGRGALGDEIGRAWRRMTGDEEADVPPIADVEGWIAKRNAVLGAVASIQDIRITLDEAERDGRQIVERLRRALQAVGREASTDDLDILFQRAQTVIDAAATLTSLRAAVREREVERTERHEALKTAERDQQDWLRVWHRACASCWLGIAGPAPSIAFVRQALKELIALGAVWDRRVALVDRIEKMELDVAAYAAEAETIAQLIGEPTAGVPESELAGRVKTRIGSAIVTRDKRKELEASLADTRGRRDTLMQSQSVIARRIAEMTGFFKVGSTADLAEKLAQTVLRASLHHEVAEIQREIVEALGCSSIAEAEAVLDAANREALVRERSEAKPRLDDLDQRCRELFATWRAAADHVATMGGDAKAAELEERRRTTQLEIEHGALRYIKLRAGVSAMEKALHLYRDVHRGTMMERASEAFSSISRGAYTGLKTQPQKDREVLIAEQADGGSKDANALSKGARFQLYLALRAAGYLEYARASSAPPFVADDIMETFDDFRAEEALRLFLKMTEVGQVIYLTHHRHLLPIAREVCPNVHVHLLGPVSA